MAISLIRNANKILLPSIGIFLFCSCGGIKGRISSSQNEQHVDGATFIVIRQQSISLTDSNIATFIAQKMKEFGFVEAKNKEEAYFAVVYTHSIGAGETTVWGKNGKVFSATNYPRSFVIAIIDLRRTVDLNNPVILWQAELYSTGSSPNIARLYECFVEESFKLYGTTAINKKFSCP